MCYENINSKIFSIIKPKEIQNTQIEVLMNVNSSLINVAF